MQLLNYFGLIERDSLGWEVKQEDDIVIQKEKYEGLEAVGGRRENGTDMSYIKERESTGHDG